MGRLSEEERAARRRRVRRRTRRRRRAALASVAAAAIALAGTTHVAGLGPWGSEEAGARVTVDPSDDAAATSPAPPAAPRSARRPPLGVDAHVVRDGGRVRVRVTVRGGPDSSGARAVALDDRDRRAAISGWIPSGRTATVRVPPRLLDGGPARVRVQTRAGADAGPPGPMLLVARPPAPVRARTVSHVDGSGPRVALVFDDGIDAGAMRSIVATLRRKGASATFCLNGYAANRWDEGLRRALRAAVRDGTVENCSHGHGHRTGTHTTHAEARADLARNVAGVDRMLGATSRPLYRPPFGRLSPGLRRAAGELGYSHILLWDVDPGDYLRPSPGTITRRVVRDARPGSVTVLHLLDGTAAALPAIIDGLRGRGLEPVGALRMLRGADRRAAAAAPGPTAAPGALPPPPAGEAAP